MAYLQVRYYLQSLGPALMHNPQGMAASSNGGSGPASRIPTPEEEARAGLYRLDTGQLYWPSVQFRESAIRGNVGQKITNLPGRPAAPKIIAASVMLMSEVCPLVDPETSAPLTDYGIDIRRAVLKSRGRLAAVMRARPRIERWATAIDFEIDTSFMSPELLESALNLAGRVAGVGDYRVGRGGMFGRFVAELDRSSDG